MSGGEVLLRIAGDAEAYRKELEKIPGFTAAQAKRASDAWARSQSIAAAQVSAGIRKSGEDAAKAWSEVGKKLGTLAGGPFATIADVVTELVPKAGAASSAIGGIAVAGAGVAAAAVSIAAVATAAFRLAGAAEAARDRLAEAGRTAEIPGAARDGILAYTRATTELSQAWDLLTATLGGMAGGALAAVVSGMAAAVAGLAKMYGAVYRAENAVDLFRGVTEVTSRVLLGVGTLGLSEVARHYGLLGTAAEDAAEDVRTASSGMVDAWQEAAEQEDEIRRENAKRAARLLEERAREEKRAADERRREAERAAREAASLEEQIRRAVAADTENHYDKMADMREGLTEARAAFEVRDQEITAASNRIMVENTVAGIERIKEEISKLESDTEKAAQMREDALVASWTAMGDSLSAVGDLSSLISDSIAGDGEKMTKAQKKAAREWAQYAKAIAITTATLSAVEGVAKALASAPPPFNIPAVISATAAGAVQVGRAVATKIPSFFAGGRDRGDGEGLARLHAGESVLNARATDAIVRALNTGLSPLSGMATAGGPADVYLDGRQVGRAIARAQRAGRWAAHGPPPGYSRRRGR